LTRASIEQSKVAAKKMDCRVKPGNDPETIISYEA
jgi:hypothetical protein